MSGITKNQHFVPQSLLKNFSTRREKTMGIYDSKRKILRDSVSARKIFSENYFYDKDNTTENFLAEHVEGPAGPIFEGIVKNPKEKISRNKIDLLRFIAVQLNRTPRALSNSIENISNFGDLLIQQHAKLNGIDPEIAKDIKVRVNQPKTILNQQTVDGALNWPLIYDLDYQILIDQTNTGFVICDHPVVHYNWYLRNSNDPRHTSLVSCGLQIFLPISHSITLCFYDGKIYKMGPRKKTYTKLMEPKDILLLNELQFRNRGSFVVFPHSLQSEYVQKECKKFPPNSLHKNNSWASDFTTTEREKVKSTVAIWRRQNKLNRWLSCCKIKSRVRQQKVECYHRNPGIVQAHQLFMEELRSKHFPNK
jgi:hypothetical protein